MKATIKDGSLQIDLEELVDSLGDEERKILMQHAAFKERLMVAICDTVATGCAFDGDWWIGDLPEKLRVALLPLMPQGIGELCRRLLEQRDRYKGKADELQGVLSALSGHWPKEVARDDSYWEFRPGPFVAWDAGAVDAYISGKIGKEQWEAIKSLGVNA